MSKTNKKKSQTQQLELKNLQEFSNKYDLGKCIVISISTENIWYSEDLDSEIVKNTLYSTLGNIYAEITEKNGTNQAVKDWVNQDIENAIWLIKKLYLEQNNE